MFFKNKESRIDASVGEWRTVIQQHVRLGSETKSSKERRRKNFVRAFLMCTISVAAVVLLAFVGAKMTGDMGGDEMSPIKIELKTDGLLDEHWLRSWAGISSGTRDISIINLRKKLESYGQVKQADVYRGRGNTLFVTLRERTAAARIRDGDSIKIVASDGVLFPAATFVIAQNKLPFITDAKIVSADGGCEQIDGADALLRFLAVVRHDYPQFFLEWESISVKDLPSGEITGDAPWAVIRVTPLAEAQNPGFPKIESIVFTAQHFEQELAILGSADTQAKIEHYFAESNRNRGYKIVFLTNRKNAHRTFQEMHIIPVNDAGTSRRR